MFLIIVILGFIVFMTGVSPIQDYTISKYFKGNKETCQLVRIGLYILLCMITLIVHYKEVNDMNFVKAGVAVFMHGAMGGL
jgi:hypothetical protein